MDQANRLRDIINQKNRLAEEASRRMNARVITVTSGKGGVGKSNFAVNLAIQLRRMQKRVILIDADFGLANVEVLFGINPQYNFGDVLAGSVTLEGALALGPMGVQFLSGGSGMTALADITEKQMTVLLESFASLDSMTDVILIDTGAGISKTVISFIRASQETVVVTTPDPTAITDAYAAIKAAKEGGGELPSFKIVVNRVENMAEGADVFDKMYRVCEQFLGIKLISLGNIPYDMHLTRAVKKQEPVLLAYPKSESAQRIEAIGLKLMAEAVTENTPSARTGLRGFIGKLVNILGK